MYTYVCVYACVCVCVDTYSDAAYDPALVDHLQVHEGVLDPDQDVGGDPVAGCLVDVGAGGVGVVPPGGRGSWGHGAVAHRAGARTRLGEGGADGGCVCERVG